MILVSLGTQPGSRMGAGRVQVQDRDDGPVVVTDTPVVEVEELQGIIAEGQEKGFLAAEALATALEEAELSPRQTQDLLGYLEEHGVDVLRTEETESAELQASGRGEQRGDGREED